MSVKFLKKLQESTLNRRISIDVGPGVTWDYKSKVTLLTQSLLIEPNYHNSTLHVQQTV